MKSSIVPTIAVPELWICPTCTKSVPTSFCPECGEGRQRANDLTLRGFVSQVVHACTNIDGPLLRSLRCVLLRPGVLTVAYLEGQRKLYTLPLQLFLVANILFFAMQSLTGAKIFSTPLDQHLHSDMWGGVAQKLVAHHVETRRTTEAQYAPVFNQAVAQNGKSLIVLMVLPFALLPAILFRGSGRPFVADIVFSLHFYSFLMFLFCIFLIVVGVSLLAGGRGWHRRVSIMVCRLPH